MIFSTTPKRKKSSESLQNSFAAFRVFNIARLFLIFLFVLSFFSTHAFAKSGPQYAAIIMDANSGKILHQENADVKVHPASLTKMMTLLMTFDALNRGQIRLNSQIPISNHAASMVPSKLGLRPGSTIRVEDAIYALVTKSANDIAVALAERLGGTESNFAAMMTKKARALGMSRTRFKNASGLHDPGQVTTARDYARLSLVLIHDYKLYYHYFSKQNFVYKGKTYRNHNRLMETYKGMDGLKTGYIAASGFNLAASAVRGNKRLIGVVMGGKTSKSRNDRMAQLLDQGFGNKSNGFNFSLSKAQYMDIPVISETSVLANNNANIPVPKIKPVYVKSTGKIYRPDTRPAQNNDVSKEILQATKEIEMQSNNTLKDSIEISKSEVAADPASENTEKPEISKTYLNSGDSKNWAIQIGAFSSRDRTNKALGVGVASLPQNLRYAKAMIAPLKTESGWIFRARLTGYTEDAAYKACKAIKECLVISPNAQ